MRYWWVLGFCVKESKHQRNLSKVKSHSLEWEIQFIVVGRTGRYLDKSKKSTESKEASRILILEKQWGHERR